MHHVAIPPEVRAAISAVRGPDPIQFPLAGPRTALLVIDMQNYFLQPGAPAEVPFARSIVPNINCLARAVRSAGGLVAWIQMTAETDPSGWSRYYARMGPERARERIALLTAGTATHALYDGLEVQAGDEFVSKLRFSAFTPGSSDLDERLQARGIETVVVTGALTNVCCESTARDAMMLNYGVAFVSDANATRDDDAHNATLITMLRSFADVSTTDETIAALGAA